MRQALKQRIRRPSRSMVVALLALFVALGSSANAVDRLIGGRDIKPNAVTSRHIRDGTVTIKDLSRGAIRRLAIAGPAGLAGARGADGAAGRDGVNGTNGVNGQNGTQGTPGRDGATGRNGTNGRDGADGQNGQDGQDGQDGAPGPQLSSGNWGVLLQNTIGSASAQLRSGPSGTTGSVNLLVGTRDSKIAYGNRDDFYGQPLNSINAVGFRVYNTGENITAGGADNLPNVTFEVVPNIPGSDGYSSLVFVPRPSEPIVNTWAEINATTSGRWYLTGSEGAAIDCALSGSDCSWADIQAKLPDATIRTVAIAKGRDNTFQGAVDWLQLAGTTYDFEETGVFARPSVPPASEG